MGGGDCGGFGGRGRERAKVRPRQNARTESDVLPALGPRACGARRPWGRLPAASVPRAPTLRATPPMLRMALVRSPLVVVAGAFLCPGGRDREALKQPASWRVR